MRQKVNWCEETAERKAKNPTMEQSKYMQQWWKRRKPNQLKILKNRRKPPLEPHLGKYPLVQSGISVTIFSFNQITKTKRPTG